MWNDLFSSPRWSLLFFGVLILPVLVAIWCMQWFVTQDGPAHLYNAHILIELLKGNTFLAEVYTPRWYPLPNLAGHLSLMGLMSILAPRTADRVMMSLTFVGLASSVVWLRWQVAGWKGMALIVPLAVVLALNWMWLMGFYSFLLGACLFLITLGVWWAGRERIAFGRALAIAGMLILGYLCHLATLGLTVVGLAVLTLTTPGAGWLRRCVWTAISIVPLVPLGITYYGLMQASSDVQPNWEHISKLPDLLSLHVWYKHLQSANCFALSRSIRACPFISWGSPWFRLLAPTMWVVGTLVLLVSATIFAQRKRNESCTHISQPWAVLALLLLAGWVIAPDDLGKQHGFFLRERFLLLGLVSVVPTLKLDLKIPSVWVSAAALLIAVALQVAFVWDYALTSNHLAGEFMQAKPYVGTNRRVATLLVYRDRGKYKVNPLRNLGNMFGVSTGNIVWSNYEVSEYYFPVKYRDDLANPLTLVDWAETGEFFDGRDSKLADGPLDQWAHLLARSHHAIDVLVVWGTNTELDAINTQWYGPGPVFEGEYVRVFQHR